MASRGSAIQRFLRYVREADVDEMRVALQLAKEIAERRLSQSLGGGQAAASKVKRTRKVRTQAQGATTLKPGDIIETGSLADA